MPRTKRIMSLLGLLRCSPVVAIINFVRLSVKRRSLQIIVLIFPFDTIKKIHFEIYAFLTELLSTDGGTELPLSPLSFPPFSAAVFVAVTSLAVIHGHWATAGNGIEL